MGQVVYVCPNCKAQKEEVDRNSSGTVFKPEKRVWHDHGCGVTEKVVNFLNPDPTTDHGFLGGLFDFDD